MKSASFLFVRARYKIYSSRLPQTGVTRENTKVVPLIVDLKAILADTPRADYLVISYNFCLVY
jgi:hypothetical protein